MAFENKTKQQQQKKNTDVKSSKHNFRHLV